MFFFVKAEVLFNLYGFHPTAFAYREMVREEMSIPLLTNCPAINLGEDLGFSNIFLLKCKATLGETLVGRPGLVLSSIAREFFSVLACHSFTKWRDLFSFFMISTTDFPSPVSTLTATRSW